MKILKRTDKYEIILVSEIENPDHDSNDLIVKLVDGRYYSATIFTVAYIQDLMNTQLQSGDFLNGNYFWTSDSLIMRRITQHEIIDMVEAFINNDLLDSAMMRHDDENEQFWHEPHERLKVLLSTILSLYLGFKKSGKCYPRGYQMKLLGEYYEPDMMVVLKENYKRLTQPYLDGAANAVIEIISLESGSQDRGLKYYQYQEAGVPEYWIIDPIRKSVDIYGLDSQGYYQRIANTENTLRSNVLSQFTLDIALLWKDKLPTGQEIIKLVQAMLK